MQRANDRATKPDSIDQWIIFFGRIAGMCVCVCVRVCVMRVSVRWGTLAFTAQSLAWPTPRGQTPSSALAPLRPFGTCAPRPSACTS